MQKYIVSFFFIAFAASVPLFAQKADRSKAPATGKIKPLQLPEIQQFKLASGLPVYLVEKPGIPIVQFELNFSAGSIFDPKDRLGLARMTADMLDEGAGDRNALELSEEIDFLGISLRSTADREQLTLRMFTPTSKLDQSLPLLADILLRPRFEEKELERKRIEALVELAQAHDESRIIANVAFNQLVFGKEHPYGRSASGTEESLKAMKVEDLKAFHQEFLTPANGYLVIVGDIRQEQAREMLDKAFAGWKGGQPKSITVPEPPRVEGLHIYLVDKPGAAQSELRFGHPGVSRKTKDYFPLSVMNTILGGSFTSRLNQNIREEHGYSYGARSNFYQPRHTGYFQASSAVQTDVTDKAIQEFMKELKGIRQISEEDAEKARNYEALSFPGEFEQVERIAGNVSSVVFYGLPDDYLNQYMASILAVSKEDIIRSAQTYVHPDDMIVVVVGDKSKIEQGIEALQLGQIHHLSKEAVLGEVPKVKEQP